MQNIDLSQFQFDYDLTWAGLCLHPDGTVFARYGSRSVDGPMANNSLKGLRTTLERALEAYRDYPANRGQFAPKRGPQPKYQNVNDLPATVIRNRISKPASERNCVHCHNVYDAQHEIAVHEKRYAPTKFWKYPLPEQIGISLDTDDGTRITQVLPDSPAEDAGLQPGDVLETLGGQPIFSIADAQFVLHFLPDEAQLSAAVRRGGQTHKRKLALSQGWREGNLKWRVSMYGMPPRPGLYVQPLTEKERQKYGVAENALGMIVRGLFRPAVRRSLRKNDVILAIDGHNQAMTAQEFHAYIRLHHYQPGSVMKLHVLRGGRKTDIDVKF